MFSEEFSRKTDFYGQSESAGLTNFEFVHTNG